MDIIDKDMVAPRRVILGQQKTKTTDRLPKAQE